MLAEKLSLGVYPPHAPWQPTFVAPTKERFIYQLAIFIGYVTTAVILTVGFGFAVKNYFFTDPTVVDVIPLLLAIGFIFAIGSAITSWENVRPPKVFFSYGEFVNTTNNTYEIAMRNYNEGLIRYNEKFKEYDHVSKRWDLTYYCGRCDGVFIPGESGLIPSGEMDSLLYEGYGQG